MTVYSEACKEFDSLLSETELVLDRKKYPRLAAMQKRGNKLHWDAYFTKGDNNAEV